MNDEGREGETQRAGVGETADRPAAEGGRLRHTAVASPGSLVLLILVVHEYASFERRPRTSTFKIIICPSSINIHSKRLSPLTRSTVDILQRPFRCRFRSAQAPRSHARVAPSRIRGLLRPPDSAREPAPRGMRKINRRHLCRKFDSLEKSHSIIFCPPLSMLSLSLSLITHTQHTHKLLPITSN